jgi:folylpolyglutamate synthase
MSTSDEKSFETALAALYSTEHQARTKEALEKTALRRECTIHDMREYMLRASIELPKSVAIVHITGTKGKGSTACLCESILRTSGLKTGLFTSPHLVGIRERIRIGGCPISEQVFGQAYWAVRCKLEENASEEGSELPTLPGYFRMLTLMAYYTFSNYEPALDVIILEVGMGGRYDATNVFDFEDRQVACGVTLLDLDHTRVLGDTLEQIGWEKGGIFKVNKSSNEPQSPKPSDGGQPTKPTIPADSGRCFYAIGTNTPSALKVLEGCAAIEGQGSKLHVIYENPDLEGVDIGLQGSHQRINAALATALCKDILKHKLDTATLHKALQNARWPGRCQTVSVVGSAVNLRLDGAHTPKSLDACLEWYRDAAGSEAKRVLLFNCSHERNPVPLLQQLHKEGFRDAYFCPADFERPSGLGKPRAKGLLEQAGFVVTESDEDETPTWQETLAEIWTHLDGLEGNRTAITCNSKVKEALAQILTEKDVAMEVLVAGSLYLVGSALDAIEWKEVDAAGTLLI